MNKSIIEISNLTKIFNREGIQKINAVDNVSFQVKEGEFLTILGASGSGKTTLLNLIGGLDKASSGSIILDGIEINGLKEDQLIRIRREKVGYVFQNFNLIPTFSASENIEAALAPINISTKKKTDRVNELLDLMDLRNRSNHLPMELSSGEQQRVAIARALVNKPSILLLDEPTGNLDTNTGKEILKFCFKTSKDTGQTILAVSHADYVKEYSDRILYMRDGKLLPNLINSDI